jgi:DNA-binding MurR/RpiR family transcriptional regulator
VITAILAGSSKSDVFDRGLRATLAPALRGSIECAVALLSDPRGRVLLFLLLGGRFSHVLMAYLLQHLVQLRQNVTPISDNPVVAAGQLIDVGARDVLVVFDFRRYQPGVATKARVARDRGASLVLLTDPWLSPISEFTQLMLPARVEVPSPRTRWYRRPKSWRHSFQHCPKPSEKAPHAAFASSRMSEGPWNDIDSSGDLHARPRH